MANNKVLKRRVVVTGLGAITPIGNSVAEFWDGIRKGKVGIGETQSSTLQIISKTGSRSQRLCAGNHMDKKAARRMEAFSQYALQQPEKVLCEDSGLEIEKRRPISRWRDDWFWNWKSSGSRAEL